MTLEQFIAGASLEDQVSSVFTTKLSDDFRLDSEHYKLKYLQMDELLQSMNVRKWEDLDGEFIGGPFGSAFTVNKYVDLSPYRYIRGKDVKPFFLLDNDNAYMPEEDYERLSKYALEENDLLVSVVGTLGNVTLINEQVDKAIFSCKSTAYRSKSVDPYYLSAYLNSSIGQAYLQRKARGAVQLGLNLPDLKGIPIYLPREDEQEAIGNLVRESWQKLKSSKKSYVEAEEMLLAALGLDGLDLSPQLSYTAMFDEVETASRFDSEYYQPKYFQLRDTLQKAVQKHGWALTDIKGLSKPLRYGSSTKLAYLKSGVPFLRIADVNNYRFDPETLKYISKKDAKQESTASVLTGDVLISRSGTLGLAVEITDDLDGAIYGSYFIRTRPDNDKIHPAFLALYINSLVGQLQVEQSNTGGIQTNLTISAIESIQIALPPMPTQKMYVEKVVDSRQSQDEAKQLLETAKQRVEQMILGDRPIPVQHKPDHASQGLLPVTNALKQNVSLIADMVAASGIHDESLKMANFSSSIADAVAASGIHDESLKIANFSSSIADAVAASGIHDELSKTANFSASFTSSISGMIDSLNLVDHSAAYKAMNSASLSIAELFNANDIIADAFKAMPSILESWQEPLDSAYKSIIEADGAASALLTKDVIDGADLLRLEANAIRPAELHKDALEIMDSVRLAAEYNDLQQHEAEKFECLAAEYDDFQQYEAEKFERLAAEYDDLYEDSQFARLAAEQLAIDSHLAEMSELSLLSQSSLAQLEFEQMGNALQLTTSMQDILQDNVLDLTQTYFDLIRSFEDQPSIISSLPAFVSKSPTVALFNETNLLESITVQEGGEVSLIEQKQHARKEIQSENNSRLPELLAKLDTNLIPMWNGARYSLNSNNPDRERHTIVSLRELFTHVLHTLAPNVEVVSWTNDPKYYHNGNPTRRARLLYICRRIDHGSFASFVEKDVQSILGIFDLFQKGTHKVSVEYTESQLHAIVARVESTLGYLLEVGRVDN